MKFVSAPTVQPVVDFVVTQLTGYLAAGPVTWLVSGGSCIPVEVAVAQRLRATRVKLSSLAVSLIDERYGPPGHPDSNWAQLQTAGFELPGAELRPWLEPGLSPAATAVQWEVWLKDRLTTGPAVGLLGIGPDGHTSGIKPHSPALDATGYACAYDWDDYSRLTTTPLALAALDETAVYAAGATKWPVLRDLTVKPARAAAGQPAQLLRASAAVTIFTDDPELTS